MHIIIHPEQKNRVLERLSPTVRETMLHRSKIVPLVRGDVLHEAGDMIEHVYFPFPLSGMISLLAIMHEGEAIETGIVGHEGLVGGSIGNDSNTSFGQSLVQIAGTLGESRPQCSASIIKRAKKCGRSSINSRARSWRRRSNRPGATRSIPSRRGYADGSCKAAIRSGATPSI